jgi:diphosphomevalonate decarboxylase
LKKRDAVAILLAGRALAPAKAEGRGAAAANIALCKYWGKRNEELNLPITSSLSVSLGELGTRTRILPCAGRDEVALNGQPVAARSKFATRLSSFLDLFRPAAEFRFRVETDNSIPTAAGLASSASGFAALVLALNDLFGWGLDPRSLSILARLGSGSAARSIFDGFVEWHAGAAADGMDSFAEPLPYEWPDLRMGLLVVSSEAKPVGSREAMRRTRRTSVLYEAWPIKVAHDLVVIKDALREGDFDLLGRVAESNALAMHATGLAAWPPVLYWRPATVAQMHRVWEVRDRGLRVYFTMDAGPNVKLLFPREEEPSVRESFPDVQVVAPFGPEAG